MNITTTNTCTCTLSQGNCIAERRQMGTPPAKPLPLPPKPLVKKDGEQLQQQRFDRSGGQVGPFNINITQTTQQRQVKNQPEQPQVQKQPQQQVHKQPEQPQVQKQPEQQVQKQPQQQQQQAQKQPEQQVQKQPQQQQQQVQKQPEQGVVVREPRVYIPDDRYRLDRRIDDRYRLEQKPFQIELPRQRLFDQQVPIVVSDNAGRQQPAFQVKLAEERPREQNFPMITSGAQQERPRLPIVQPEEIREKRASAQRMSIPQLKQEQQALQVKETELKTRLSLIDKEAKQLDAQRRVSIAKGDQETIQEIEKRKSDDDQAIKQLRGEINNIRLQKIYIVNIMRRASAKVSKPRTKKTLVKKVSKKTVKKVSKKTLVKKVSKKTVKKPLCACPVVKKSSKRSSKKSSKRSSKKSSKRSSRVACPYKHNPCKHHKLVKLKCYEDRSKPSLILLARKKGKVVSSAMSKRAVIQALRA